MSLSLNSLTPSITPSLIANAFTSVLRSFSRWQKWREIANLVPIAVVDRMGTSLYAISGRAAQALARFRIPDHAAATLPGRKPPAWVYLHGLKSPLSSTALRAARRKPGDG